MDVVLVCALVSLYLFFAGFFHEKWDLKVVGFSLEIVAIVVAMPMGILAALEQRGVPALAVLFLFLSTLCWVAKIIYWVRYWISRFRQTR